MKDAEAGWDYRVVYFPNMKTYEVMEVYYDDKGNPEGYCETTSLGDSLVDCRRDVIRKEEATYKPVLIFENGKFKGEQNEKHK